MPASKPALARVLARDLMQKPGVTARPDETMETVARRMLARRASCVLVVDGRGTLKGILTEGDFMAQERGVPFSRRVMPKLFGQWVDREDLETIYAEARTRRVKDVMNVPVARARETATVQEIGQLMLEFKVKHIPIVRGKKAVGVVARHDFLKLLLPR